MRNRIRGEGGERTTEADATATPVTHLSPRMRTPLGGSTDGWEPSATVHKIPIDNLFTSAPPLHVSRRVHGHKVFRGTDTPRSRTSWDRHPPRFKDEEEGGGGGDDEFSRMILSFLRRVVELSNFIGGWLVRLSKERH